MSKVKATPRSGRRTARKAAYFVVRGRRVRVDQVELLIPQADGTRVRMLLDKMHVHYVVEGAVGRVTSSIYQHETLMPALQ